MSPAPFTRPRRIGVWPPLPIGVWARRPARDLPYPLQHPDCRLFARARHGLFHGVTALGLRPGDEVLVPAYHHGSEIEALHRAGLGLRFYDVTPSLEPDEDQLRSLLGPEVRALYLIHYFGVPQNLDRWRAWSDRHGLHLLEDAAMAFLATFRGRPVGSTGDLAIYCLYKSFGLPDGGALISREPPTVADAQNRRGLRDIVARHGSWLAQRGSLFASLHAALRQGGEAGDGKLAAGGFSLGVANSDASGVTHALIPRLVDASAAAIRRRNEAYLRRALDGLVTPLFDEVPDGASPVAFMFRLDPGGVDALREELAASGVRLARYWPVPHPATPEGFENAGRMRAEVAGLPVHQELRPRDIRTIAMAARAAFTDRDGGSPSPDPRAQREGPRM